MKFSEQQVKDIVSIKENLIKQIDVHSESIETLEKSVLMLDLFLKDSSFVKASQITNSGNTVNQETASNQETPKQETTSNQDSTPIKDGKGTILANAHITAQQVSIVLDKDTQINADTPPFKTFFLDRILGEMLKKDSKNIADGKIKQALSWEILKDGARLEKIIIKNYKDKERVTELINTAGWSFARMLENMKK